MKYFSRRKTFFFFFFHINYSLKIDIFQWFCVCWLLFPNSGVFGRFGGLFTFKVCSVLKVIKIIRMGVYWIASFFQIRLNFCNFRSRLKFFYQFPYWSCKEFTTLDTVYLWHVFVNSGWHFKEFCPEEFRAIVAFLQSILRIVQSPCYRWHRSRGLHLLLLLRIFCLFFGEYFRSFYLSRLNPKQKQEATRAKNYNLKELTSTSYLLLRFLWCFSGFIIALSSFFPFYFLSSFGPDLVTIFLRLSNRFRIVWRDLISDFTENWGLLIYTCQRIRKRPSLQLSIAHCSDTAHYIDETIIIISLKTRWLFSQLWRSRKSRTQFCASCTATHRSGTTQGFGARLTVEASSSITNSPSAEPDTPSMNGNAALPSSK